MRNTGDRDLLICVNDDFTIVTISNTSKHSGFTNSVDCVYNKLTENSVYWFSAFQVKRRKYFQYSVIKNTLAVNFGGFSSVEPSSEDEIPGPSNRGPKITYIKISEVKNMDSKKMNYVNVIGIVLYIGSVQAHLTQNSKKDTKKRSITIMDSTERTVELVLWSDNVNKITTKQTVISVENAKVCHTQQHGITLHVWFRSKLSLDQDTQEAKDLLQWYNDSFLAVSDGSFEDS